MGDAFMFIGYTKTHDNPDKIVAKILYILDLERVIPPPVVITEWGTEATLLKVKALTAFNESIQPQRYE